MSDRRIEYLELGKVKPAKRNPKKHAGGELIASVGRFGFTEPLIVDERTGRLVAGHGRLEALQASERDGAEVPEGVRVADDGRWLVPVVRGWASKNDRDADAYLLASNQLTTKGGWDDPELAKLLGELAKEDAIAGTGFDSKDVDALLKGIATADDPAADDGARATEPEPDAVYVKPGEIYRVGPHLVACADSLDGDTVSTLFTLAGVEEAAAVVTDPPYAIYGSSTGIGADIADDKMVIPFFEKVVALARARLRLFGHAYFFTDWRSWSALWLAARRERLTGKNALVWNKGGAGLGSMYAMTYELIGFFVKQPEAKAMKSNAGRGHRTVYDSNVMNYNRVTGDEREHNAAKPVALLRRLIENSTDPGDLVFDPFCGSGSTLIAANEAKRRCLTIDVEPKWVQVTIERYERRTGEKAIRVSARDVDPATRTRGESRRTLKP